MAGNDVVLLDSLIEKAQARFGNRDASETFELFCFDQVLKDLDLSYEELETGWTDGPEDGGIDGFYVFVDGRLASSDSLAYAARRDPAIRVVIFTVRRSDSFQQEPLNSLAMSLAELLDLRKSDSEFVYPFSDAILAQRTLFRETIVALAERRPRLTVDILVCSRGDTSTLASNLTQRAQQLRDLLTTLFSEARATVEFKGAAELLDLARRQPTHSLPLRFIESYISREGRNYIVLATLPDYFAFVSDERGKLRRYLFEANVRDYLGPVQINQDIRRSLQRRVSAELEDFWWLNNGVTILATHATVVGKELHLENVEIVNGLQTTETVFQHFSDVGVVEPEPRSILLKIILTSDEQTRSRIIKATNYQNTVDLASLRGLDTVQRDIDQFLADHGWFYDRRKNYYKNQGRPAERIVSIPYLAAAVRAIALGDPARSQRQRSRSLRDDATYVQVFRRRWDLRIYLASLEIVHAVESALQARRTVHDTLPIALVHFVGFVYACSKLGKSRYRPAEVARLAGAPPSNADVIAIRDDLREAAHRMRAAGRRVDGVTLSREFINWFVIERFGPGSVDERPPVADPERRDGGEGPGVVKEVRLDSLDMQEVLEAASEKLKARERVDAAYGVLEQAVRAIAEPGAGRVPFKGTLRKAAIANGATPDEFEKTIGYVFMLRGRVLRDNHEPSDRETSGYVRAVAAVLRMIGYEIGLDVALKPMRKDVFG